jgi:type II pantothenate kinase
MGASVVVKPVDSFHHVGKNLAHNILRICRLRENNLRAHGLADPYAPVKHEQNEAAMKLLPDVLAELDAIDPADRLEALIRGVFAGNVFDLGAVSTNTRFDEGGFDFHHTREDIADRPWLFDDFEALARRWAGTPHRKAVVFVDNAGADLLLGMVPLCRQMLQRGTTVVLTANTLPALNDITIDELPELLDRIAGFDRTIADALADGRLSGIASGNDAPLIDLRQVSPELAEAAADADLVVLEGMGRAVETNLHAAFTCDALKLAIIKEQHLAAQLGGRLYDTVCKFEPAA